MESISERDASPSLWNVSKFTSFSLALRWWELRHAGWRALRRNHRDAPYRTSYDLSGQTRRDGLEPHGPTHGANRFTVDPVGRAQCSKASRPVERTNVRQGLYQP